MAGEKKAAGKGSAAAKTVQWTAAKEEEQERIVAGKERPVQVRKARQAGWTARRRAIFLDHLAATCNVTASAAASGLHWSGAYALRRRDAEFAAQWQAALVTGYERLEAMLIERAGGAGPLPEAGEDGPAAPDLRKMDTELSLSLLKMHRAGVRGQPRSGGLPPRRASRKELTETLLKLLSALKRRRVKKAAA